MKTVGVEGGHVEILRRNAALNKGHINRMNTKEWAGGGVGGGSVGVGQGGG